MLLIEDTLKEFLMTQDTLIYLLQSCYFVIHIQKFLLNPTPTLQFLGSVVNSQGMKLSLSKEKIFPIR